MDPDVDTEGGLTLVDLVSQILARAESPAAASEQLARLVAATQAIASELELSTALRTVVEVACDIVSARYGAIGVISADGMLEEFIHVGMDDALVETLGHPPTGRGILGAVIAHGAPIRLEKLSTDPRSVGFPPNHPPMGSFLGVPVRIRGVVYGNLYLTESANGVFDETDQQVITTLAAMAGTAIANARLYEEARLAGRWVAASEEINRRLLSEELADSDLSFIAGLVIDLADAAFVGLVLPGDERFAVQYGALSYNATLDRDAAFQALPGAVNEVLASDGDPEAYRSLESFGARITGFGPMLVFPWVETGTSPDGAFVVARGSGTHQFSAAERQMASRFVRSVSIARELAAARNDRERIALADERDRIARDLHDHVIQSLFAVGLSLQGLVSGAPAKTASRISAQIDAIDVTIRQIRQTIFQLNGPPTLAHSQKQKLNQLVRTTLEGEGIDSSLDFSGPIDTLIDSELGDEVSAVLREALSNVVRHAEASRVDISVAVSATGVRVVVTDNGRGLGVLRHRSGLDNLAARAERRGGTFTVAAKAPAGTTLDWAVPVA